MRLSEQIRHAKEAGRQQEEYVAAFNRRANRIEYQDALDEREGADFKQYASHTRETRGLERLFKAESEAYGEMTEEVQGDLRYRAWMNVVRLSPKREQDVLDQQRESWHGQRKTDLSNNFLHEAWLEQLEGVDPIRTFAMYSVVHCAKSVIDLLTLYPRGEELIYSILPTGSILPSRNSALQLIEDEEYEPHDHIWFMENAWSRVAGLFDAAESIMLRYGDFVRAVQEIEQGRVTVEAPDDPFGVRMVREYETSPEARMELAINEYLTQKTEADHIARRYKVPQKQFRRILKERGLMQARGGDRKGKK